MKLKNFKQKFQYLVKNDWKLSKNFGFAISWYGLRRHKYIRYSACLPTRVCFHFIETWKHLWVLNFCWIMAAKFQWNGNKRESANMRNILYICVFRNRIRILRSRSYLVVFSRLSLSIETFAWNFLISIFFWFLYIFYL